MNQSNPIQPLSTPLNAPMQKGCPHIDVEYILSEQLVLGRLPRNVVVNMPVIRTRA